MTDVYEYHVLHAGGKYALTGACVHGDTLILACDDGQLRVFDVRDEGASGRTRPELVPKDLVPRGQPPSRERRHMRELTVMPEWNALLAIADGSVLAQPLDALGRTSIVLPNTKECLSYAASASAGAVAVSFRTGVAVFTWTEPVVSARAAGGRTASTAATALNTFGTFDLLGEFPIQVFSSNVAAGTGAAPMGITTGTGERQRRNSTAGGLMGAFSYSTGTSTALVAGSVHVCVVSIGWVGFFLCVGVIRRNDVKFHRDEDDVPVLNLVPAPTGDDRDTGYSLTYLFVHPWRNGSILREVRAGTAPPLDADGFPTIITPAPAASASDPGGASGQTPAATVVAASSAAVSEMQALVGSGWAQASAGLRAASAPGGNPVLMPPWGHMACIRDSIGQAEDEDMDAEDTLGDAAGRQAVARHPSEGSAGQLGALTSADDDGAGGFDASPAPPRMTVASTAIRRRSLAVDPRRADAIGGDAAISAQQSMSAHASGRGRTASSASADSFRTMQSVDVLRGASGFVLVAATGANMGTVDEDFVPVPDAEAEEAGRPARGVPHGKTAAYAFVVEDDGEQVASLYAHTPAMRLGSYPAAVYASRNFPYAIVAQADCVEVYNTRTGLSSQRLRIPHALGFTMCPVDSQLRLDFASGRLPLQDDGSATDQAVETAMRMQRAVARPERVFVWTQSGVVLLRMVPVIMQVAALLSRRPPLFEAALSLCDHFNIIREQVHMLRERASVLGPATAARFIPDHSDELAAFDAIGGMSESKIQEIRARFGYELFAKGAFTAALEHLSNAREPVRRVLALYPQLVIPGAKLMCDFPVRMPVMIESTLKDAVKPLVPYLLSQRRRLRCGTGVVHACAEDEAMSILPPSAVAPAVPAHTTGSPRGAESASPRAEADEDARESTVALRDIPAAVLVDTALLTCYVWLEAHLRRTAQELMEAHTTMDHTGSQEPSLVPRPVAVKLHGLQNDVRRVHSACERLLSQPNCIDVQEAEVQLRAFGMHGSNEMIALYRSKGMHDRALRLLYERLSGLRHVADAPGIPPLAQSFDVTPTPSPVDLALARELAALANYLRALDTADWLLVKHYAKPLLSGNFGSLGVLYGFAALCRPNLAEAVGGHAVFSGGARSAVGQLTKLSEMLQFLDDSACAVAEHEFWALTGFGAPTTGALDENNTAQQFLASELRTVLDDCPSLPPVSGTWVMHLQAAYMEHLMAYHNATDSSTLTSLAQAYCKLLVEAAAVVSENAGGAPVFAPRIAEQHGLMRSLRTRLQKLLQPQYDIDAAELLRALPHANMHEERAELYRRLGRHEDALHIFVGVLRDFDGAERYCDEVFSMSQRSSTRSGAPAFTGPPNHSTAGSVYVSLLRALMAGSQPPTAAGLGPRAVRRAIVHDAAGGMVLTPLRDTPPTSTTGVRKLSALLQIAQTHAPAAPDAAVTAVATAQQALSADVPSALADVGSEPSARGSTDESLPRVIGILSKHYSRVDAAAALKLLPASLPLGSVTPFLVAALRKTADQQRTQTVARQLSSITHLHAKDNLGSREARFHKVDRPTPCAYCHRKLAVGGTPGPFISLPTGDLVHVGCYERGPEPEHTDESMHDVSTKGYTDTTEADPYDTRERGATGRAPGRRGTTRGTTGSSAMPGRPAAKPVQRPASRVEW